MLKYESLTQHYLWQSSKTGFVHTEKQLVPKLHLHTTA